jgi:murein DD-endopeptidase MepM/ murein hydrolase activator NlpD
LAAGIDERVIIALADAFQWNIDFATAPKKGDTFVFVYEERWRDDKYIMPANVLAAKYVNEGAPNYLYYFEEDQDNQGYFDEQGVSAQKMFLKAPIAYKYITSGFTTGLRCLESYGLCTGHRATDYAANSGTPIRAVGDGTITYAGWSSVGYGNLTSIRHNGTYSTNYAHQSKIIVKRGQHVSQGQIIGYVGSTGLSTGPHLHFELVKNGVKVNALKEILPPGKPIKEENKARFAEVIKKYQNDLK